MDKFLILRNRRKTTTALNYWTYIVPRMNRSISLIDKENVSKGETLLFQGAGPQKKPREMAGILACVGASGIVGYGILYLTMVMDVIPYDI